jgi:hypothetical protein
MRRSATEIPRSRRGSCEDSPEFPFRFFTTSWRFGRYATHQRCLSFVAQQRIFFERDRGSTLCSRGRQVEARATGDRPGSPVGVVGQAELF